MISFCIATRNRADDVYQTVQECLSLDDQGIEVIVCDNASTDNTKEKLESIYDSRFRYYRNTENIGVGRNFIKTMRLASNPYVFLLNDKDSINKNGFIKLISHLKSSGHTQYSLIYANYKGLKNVRNSVTHSDHMTILTRKEIINKEIFPKGYISGVIYNRKYFEEVIDSLKQDSDIYNLYSFRCAELAMYKYENILMLGDYLAQFRREAKPDPTGWVATQKSDNINNSDTIESLRKVYWTTYSRHTQIIEWCDYFSKLYGKDDLYKFSHVFLKMSSAGLNGYMNSINKGFDEKWNSKLRILYEYEKSNGLKHLLYDEISFYINLCNSKFNKSESSISPVRLLIKKIKYFCRIIIVYIYRRMFK